MNTKRFGFSIRVIFFAALFALFAFTMSTSAQAAVPSTLGTQFPLYVASASNSTIVRVGSNGSQSVFTSDGSLSGAYALAFDSNGNLYVASNNVIVKVDSTGTQSVFTSGGYLNGPDDLAFDSSDNLFVANINNNTIVKVDGIGTQSVFTSGGNLNLPDGLAFDNSGNLYVGSIVNNSIVKVNSVGTQSVFSSGGNFSRPQGLAFDSSGNLFVASAGNNKIVKVDSTGTQSVFTSGGNLAFPISLAFDSSDNLYVASNDNWTIVKVDSTGTQSVFTTAENLIYPQALAFSKVTTNTPAGVNVQTQPVDSTGGTTPITLNFAQVTQGGTTSLTTSSSGPPPSVGFKLGNPPTYYELSTTAVFSGPVTICINYTGINFSNEANLKLNHYENGAWVNHTISLDTANNVICASVTSLSPFAIFEPDVIYNFSGFFQPVDNLPTLNTVKAGSAIPVKFSLGGDQGLNILAAGYPSSIWINCETGAPQDAIEVTVTAGNSSLSYNAATDTYTYVWKTDKAWTGCRQLIVRLNDGTEHVVNFEFK